MGACSQTSKKQKDSEKTNQSNDILEQNKKDKSKGINNHHYTLEKNINDNSKLENLQTKSFSIIPK